MRFSRPCCTSLPKRCETVGILSLRIVHYSLTGTGAEKILVAHDKDSEELLLIQPLEGLEDDLDLRISLITS